LNSRHIGNTAVRQAIRVHQQSGQVARQNRSRILSPARVQVVELVQEVVATPATVEDLQRLIDIVSQDVEDPGLELAQVRTQISETTPFTGLLRFLSDTQNRTEIWTVLALLTMIVLYILSQQQPMKVEVVTPKVDEIVERVVEQIERDHPPEPTTTTEPNCK
jgi:hypothetical protein